MDSNPKKSQGILKQASWVFLAALLLYAGAYGFDQHMRVRRGPWIVSFKAIGGKNPFITVSQPRLNISDVTVG